ncbi:allantoin permease [Pantoea anthophila]|uniref:allantoin permease n=1 Tax=Pantoea anthophila TaxID=470931 RepID=UPI00289C6BD1|nr:allantoin permease [Pantoea anthophila]
MSKLKAWFQGPQDITEAEAVEDYAVGRVPAHYRWPIPAIILVLLGNSTAMFWFSLGADMSYQVGWPMLLLPIGYMVVFATLIGSCIMKMASKEGLSLNLMTRGLGFGYMGSAFTSLIYAVNFIFYFLFEGTIVSHAIANYAGVPVNSLTGIAIFALMGLAAIWFVWKGMSSMQFLQTWGVPIFIVLFGFCIWQLTHHYPAVSFSGWQPKGEADSNALWLVMNMANGQIVFQGLMATDYGRFARPGITHKGTATIMLGMLIPIVVVMLFGAFMAYTLMPHIQGEDVWSLALDPGFVFPLIMGLTGVLFAVITQIRINVLNLYSGSIALSNTMDMAFNYRPGRQWWMLLVWLLGVLFYICNILQYTGTFLSIAGILTNTLRLPISWSIAKRICGCGIRPASLRCASRWQQARQACWASIRWCTPHLLPCWLALCCMSLSAWRPAAATTSKPSRKICKPAGNPLMHTRGRNRCLNP